MAKSKPLTATKLLAPTQTAPTAPAITTLTLTSADMEDPFIKAWVAAKTRASVRTKILDYAATLLGQTFATFHELNSHLTEPDTLPGRPPLRRKFSRAPQITDRQVAEVLRLSASTATVPEIAASVGASHDQVRGVIARHNARPVKVVARRLTDDKKAKLRALGTTDKSVRAIAAEVPCTEDQARLFYRRESRP